MLPVHFSRGKVGQSISFWCLNMSCFVFQYYLLMLFGGMVACWCCVCALTASLACAGTCKTFYHGWPWLGPTSHGWPLQIWNKIVYTAALNLTDPKEKGITFTEKIHSTEKIMTIMSVLNVFTFKLPHKLRGCFSLAWRHWQQFCCCGHHFSWGEVYSPHIQHYKGPDLDCEHSVENWNSMINSGSNLSY